MESNTLETTASWQESKITLRQRVSYLLETGYLSDVVFLVGSGKNRKRISAHRLILSSGSKVFADMLESGTTEPIKVPDITPDIFLQLLWYIYADYLALKPKADDVKQLIYAAEKYRIPLLFNDCNAYLQSLLQNLKIDYFETPRVFGIRKLGALFVTIISYSTIEVLKSSEFLNAKLELVKLMLEVEETSVTSEYEFFLALLAWGFAECSRRKLEANLTNMKDIIKPLFPCIRFLEMPLTDFMGAINVIQGLFDNEEANQIYCNLISCKKNFNSLPSWCNTSGKRKIISSEISKDTSTNACKILYPENLTFNHRIALIRFQPIRRAAIIEGIKLQWTGVKERDFDNVLTEKASQFQRVIEVINLNTRNEEIIVCDVIRDDDISLIFRKFITVYLGDDVEVKLVVRLSDYKSLGYVFEANVKTPDFYIASCSNICCSGFVLKDLICSPVKYV